MERKVPTIPAVEDDAGDERVGDDAEWGGFLPLPDAQQQSRCKCSKLLLTYPRCSRRLEEIWDYFQRTNINGLNKLPSLAFGCVERHSDGGYHVHCFLAWDRPIHYYPATTFNVLIDDEVYHPNIRISKDKNRSHDRILHYLSKQGYEPKFLQGKYDMFPTSKDFTRKKTDFNNWLLDKRSRSRMPLVWDSVRDPLGNRIKKPDEADKTRNLWIWGPSNTRKTSWGKKFLPTEHTIHVTSNESWELYSGEQIIWYDDVYPPWRDLQTIVETTEKGKDRNIPSRTRYHNVLLRGGQVRIVIVTSNISLSAYLNTQEKMLDEEKQAYRNRFREIEIRDPIDIGPYVRVADYEDVELNGVGQVEFIDLT